MMMKTCAFCQNSTVNGVVHSNGLCHWCDKTRRKFALAIAGNYSGVSAQTDEERARVAANVYQLAEALTKRDLE
jgi:hypothetical protein